MTDEKALTKIDALPSTFDEINGMAKAFVQSGMFTDTKQLSQAIVKIQAGRELGLPPVYSMQNINMIRNRLTTSANTMAMLVKKSGRYNYRIKAHTDQACSITFYEKDGDKWVEVGESTFTIEDAKRAELIRPDSGWVKFPRAMLFSRAISQGARIYAPDAIGGIYTDEEIRSIPPRPEEDAVPLVIEPTPQPESPAPVQQQETNPATTSTNIDLDWLKESLKKIKWNESTVISWIKSKTNYTGLDFTGSLTDIISRMNAEQTAFLCKEVQERLAMK